MGNLLQRKAGGIQVAKTRCSTGTAAAYRFAVYHPDYNEHDMSKEAVMLYKLRVSFDYAALANCLQGLGANGECRLRVAFRSGSISSGSTSPVNDAVLDKWLSKELYFLKQGATVSAASLPGDALAAEFDFWNEPLWVNPAVITVAISIEQDDGGTLVFDDGNFFVEHWYKYAKASQDALSAYLGWEALG